MFKLLCRVAFFALVYVVMFPLNVKTVAAQFNTASVNCDIGTNEYGTGNVNTLTNLTPIWYMTWDDTYLYISIQNANETEAGVVYFDINPIAPVNGGSNSDGSTTGQAYDGYTPNLPLRADAVIYFKNDYRELRRSNGSGGWSLITSGNGGLGGGSDDYGEGYYCSNNRGNGAGTDDDRELRISWSALTNGGSRPSSFNWLGHIGYTNGVYGEVPTENPNGGPPAPSADVVRYFTVSSTTNGSSTNPFSQNSYTFVGTLDASGFGAISVYDFTMNSSGRTITRATGSGNNWAIGGSLRIDNGTVDFGSSTSTATVSGAVVIGASGTLKLSTGASSGGIDVGGNWANSGTFTPNSRTVTFVAGSNKTVSGATTFYNLTLNHTGSQISFGTSSITISNILTRSGGTLDEGTSTFTFTGGSGQIAGSSAKVFYNLVINGGASITTSASGNFTVSNDFTNNGTFTQNSGLTFTFSKSGTTTLSGAGTTTFGSLDVQGGTTVNASTHSFSVTGSQFTVSGGGTFSGDSSLVTFDGTTNLGSGGTYNFNNIKINSTKSLTNTSNRNFSVKGNWTNDGTFTSGTNTVTFNGTSAQTIGGTSSTTFNNLTLSNTLTSGVAQTSNVDLTVNGTLTMSQDSDLDMTTKTLTMGTASAATTSGTGQGDIRYKVCRSGFTSGTSYDFGSPYTKFGSLTFTTTPSQICVTIVNQNPNNFTNAIFRKYQLDVTGGSGISTNLQLHYRTSELNGNTESLLTLWREGGSWSNIGADTRDATNHWVRKNSVSTFSPWTMSSGSTPTAITFVHFGGEYKRRHVLLQWETGAELNTVGFDVWRKGPTGAWKKLNAEVLPTHALDPIHGAAYEFTDDAPKRNRLYKYKIEIVHADGTLETSPIFKVRVP